MHFDQRMGNSISSQFMRSVEDRLLASIDIPSRYLNDSTLQFIPDDIESIPSYFRSYETSCASRLAYVVVMDAAERHKSVDEEEWRVDSLAEEFHEAWRREFVKFCERENAHAKKNKTKAPHPPDEEGSFKSMEEDVNVNVPWSDLNLSWKSKCQKAAETSLQALKTYDYNIDVVKKEHKNAMQKAKKSNDHESIEGLKTEFNTKMALEDKKLIDRIVESLPLKVTAGPSGQLWQSLPSEGAAPTTTEPTLTQAHHEYKKKVRDAQNDHRANPYRWDFKGECVRFANKVGSTQSNVLSKNINYMSESQVETQVLNRAVEVYQSEREAEASQREATNAGLWPADAEADADVVAQSPAKQSGRGSVEMGWVQRHNRNTSMMKWVKALSRSRVSIDELWDAQIRLGITIEKSYRTAWEAIKDEPSIRRRFRPRSFLYEFVNQIAILETEAVLSKIHRESVFVTNYSEDRDTNEKAFHRDATFPRVVPHIRSVSLMDAAVRQALMVATALTIKREGGASGVETPAVSAFKSISFNPEAAATVGDNANEAEELIDKFVRCFCSEIEAEELHKPYDVELTTRMLSEELYNAYEYFDSTDVCRGKHDAVKLAERLMIHDTASGEFHLNKEEDSFKFRFKFPVVDPPVAIGTQTPEEVATGLHAKTT
jgi:hypothetical protein